jgi:murein L,D-transpeptidase YafK
MIIYCSLRKFSISSLRSLLLASIFIALAGGYIYGQSFKDEQLKYPRVRAAYAEKETLLKNIFLAKKIAYPPKRIFIRAFKREQRLEVWVSSADDKNFQLLKEYKICASSGALGPKRREGDLQVPEGFYDIDLFNPTSHFFLSLRVNYPNPSDRILGRSPRLGGDIFIHGNCVTIGCMPIEDENIKELYLLAVEARSAGQRHIAAHIFPAKMDANGMRQLMQESADNKQLREFWQNLKPGYDYFEKNHRLPAISVDKQGKYRINNLSN